MDSTINEKLVRLDIEEKRQEAIEHRDVLLAIASILKKPEGVQLFEYLFKNFEVGQTPPPGLEGNQLHETLGFLRAGNSIFKLASEADSEISGKMLAKLERKRYERIYEQHRIENGLK